MHLLWRRYNDAITPPLERMVKRVIILHCNVLINSFGLKERNEIFILAITHPYQLERLD